MSLHTFDVAFHEGKVCYVTDRAGGHDVTIECYDRSVAFLIHYTGRRMAKVGDWVRFRGKVRIDPGMNRDGTLRERNLAYYHEPGDGSDRTQWIFFELLEADASLLGPPDAMDSLRGASVHIRRHVESWHANNNVEALRETLRSIDAARDILQAELRARAIEKEELDAPVAAVSIEID